MSQEYISQLESARRLQISYKGITSLSEKFPDKLPRIVIEKEGKRRFFFKAGDVLAFKQLLNSQNQPNQIEAEIHQQPLTQRDRLRKGFVFKDGQWF